jgi:hypothetical protein
MPELGLIKTFKPGELGEAREFMLKNWKSASNIKAIAEKKGLAFWYDKGTMKISDGNEIFSADNAEDAAKIFIKFPDSTGAQEILQDLDPETLTAIDKVLRNFDLSKLPEMDERIIKTYPDFAPADAKRWGVKDELRSLAENTDYWFEKTMKKFNAPEVFSSYRNVELTSKMAQIDINTTRRAVNQILSDDSGKLISLDRRSAIVAHMSAQDETEIFKAYAKYGELTDVEQGMRNNLRKLLGEKKNGVITGLGGKFGVDPELFVSNYMTRIMDWAVKNKKELATFVTADELIDAAYGTKAPRHLKAFFKNMRASEVLTFQAIEDPIVILDHYNKIGHKQMYMTAAWEELYDNAQKANLPAEAWHKIHRYREQLMG